MRTGYVLFGRRLINVSRRTIRRHSFWHALVALLTLLSALPARAQEIPPPPYLITRDEGVAIGIAYDESRVKKLAPAGVRMTPEATGIIIMYTAGELYALPPYTSSWMGLDVEGIDAPGGAKARWMLTGIYGPASGAGKAF